MSSENTTATENSTMTVHLSIKQLVYIFLNTIEAHDREPGLRKGACLFSFAQFLYWAYFYINEPITTNNKFSSLHSSFVFWMIVMIANICAIIAKRMLLTQFHSEIGSAQLLLLPIYTLSILYVYLDISAATDNVSLVRGLNLFMYFYPLQCFFQFGLLLQLAARIFVFFDRLFAHKTN